MIPLLRAELLKLRTTRTFVAVTGFAIATSVLIAFLVALLTEPTRSTVLVDVFASDTSSFFILVLGAIGITGEWRHRTITSALLAAPDRPRFLAAKALAYAAAGLVVSLVVALTVAVTGAVVLGVRDLPLPGLAELAGQVGRNALLAALLASFGVALGALFRNQIVALVALFTLSLVVEPVLVTLAPAVGRFGPLGALSVAAAGLPPESGGLPDDIAMVSPPMAALLLLAWVGVVFVPATLLLQQRDLE